MHWKPDNSIKCRNFLNQMWLTHVFDAQAHSRSIKACSARQNPINVVTNLTIRNGGVHRWLFFWFESKPQRLLWSFIHKPQRLHLIWPSFRSWEKFDDKLKKKCTCVNIEPKLPDTARLTMCATCSSRRHSHLPAWNSCYPNSKA